jgi:hypothetical protein
VERPEIGLDELVEHWTVLDGEKRLVAGKRAVPAAAGSQVVDNSTVTGSVTQIGDVGGNLDIDR